MELPPTAGGAAVWIAVTDKIGHVNQCVALTDALGMAPARIDLIRGFNLRDGVGTKLLRRLQGLAQSLLLLRAIPAGRIVLVISGRSSEWAAKLLRWRLGGRIYVISVGTPINFPEVIDLAIMSHASAPKWRRRRSRLASFAMPEEILIWGALARRFATPAPLPSPGKRHVAVLVGGENKHFALTGEKFAIEIARIRELARSGDWRVEILLSRRTASRTEEIIRATLGDAPVVIHGRESSDRYRVLLASADFFIVTPDSVTMLSEVCLTGKPVFALDLETLAGSDGEGDRLVDAMVHLGVVRRFDGKIEDFEPRQRLDEASRIASMVADRIRAWLQQEPGPA